MALAALAALAALQLGGGEAGGLDAVWRALVVLQAARAVGLAWRYYGGAAAGGPLGMPGARAPPDGTPGPDAGGRG